MSADDIIRAWKDPDNEGDYDFDHPAGEIALDQVGGVDAVVQNTESLWTIGCGPFNGKCGGFTYTTCGYRPILL